MKKILHLVILLLTQTLVSQVQSEYAKTSTNNGFIKNEGQVVDLNGHQNIDVFYLLNTNGLNVQLRKHGFSYDVYERKTKSVGSKSEFNIGSKLHEKNAISKLDSVSEEISFHRVDIEFLDVSDDLIIREYEAIESYQNYYNVSAVIEGIHEVRSYKKILYENLYHEIDVVFFVPEDINKPVEYNFIIKPSGDISNIKMKVSGAPVTLENNALIMNLVHGSLSEIIPKSWIQNTDGESEIDITYVNRGENIFGFETDNPYNNTKSTMVIDPTPVRLWATYFGGEQDETIYNGDIKTDSNGNVFVSGYTRSLNNIASSGAFQTTYINNTGSWVGYLAKFSTDGDLVWSTYYGDRASFRGLTVDDEDKIIGVGESYNSVNIASPGTHQPALYDDPDNYFDGFIVKFNNDGYREWGTFYGGESFDYCVEVSTDSFENIYVVGHTASNQNISTPGSFRETVALNVHDNWDAFIVKLNKFGVRQWATYYGGTYGNAIDVDSNANVYMLGVVQRGEANNENISTPGAYQETYSDENSMSWTDSYLVKFNTDGQRQWGTFFGGDSYDQASGLVVDHDDNVIICGETRSALFPTTNAHQPQKGGSFYDWDAYLAKFDTNGSILWNTYYGGTEEDGGASVSVDSANNIFLVGASRSPNNIATTDSYLENNAGNDAYIAKLNPDGERLWGTYYGGYGSDGGMSIEITDNGDLYLLGYTYGSPNLATSGVYQETFNGEIDNFIVKFRDCLSAMSAATTESLCSGDTIAFSASGGESYSWSGPNGFLSTEQNPTIQNSDINDSGTYTVYIETDDCNSTLTFEVLVSEVPIANAIEPIEICEDVSSSGISSSIDTSNIEAQVLGNQTGMVISYLDSNGNLLPNPLPNPMTNTTATIETITVRVSPSDNVACYAETAFDIIVNPLPIMSQMNDLTTCDDDSDGYASFDIGNLESTLLNGQTGMVLALFHENGDQIPDPLPNTLTNSVPNQETITVRITNPNTDCYNETSFNLIVIQNPILNSLDVLYGCDDDNDGISEYFDTSNLENTIMNGQTGIQISYYTENGIELPSPLPNPFTNTVPFNQNITVRVENSTTYCFVETTLVLQTITQPFITQPNNLYACDQGNGYSMFDTATLESQLIGNQTGLAIYYYDDNNNPLPSPLPSLFQNTTPYAQTINIRVEDALNPICYSESSFDLIVNNLPEINLEENYFICNLEPFLTLTMNPNFNSYEWYYEDGTLISSGYSATIEHDGSYTLIVTQIEHNVICENSFSFNLIRSNLPEITEVNYGELGTNFIEILVSGDGDFEYSIDGINYQDDNYFSNVNGGIYEVFVRDKNGCGNDSQEVVIVDYPKFFTPNDDGYNDYWQIKGITKFPNSKIFIFDRYGKVLNQIFSNEQGWDGTYNNSTMPSSDYWFTAELGNGTTFSGHFTLKR